MCDYAESIKRVNIGGESNANVKIGPIEKPMLSQ